MAAIGLASYAWTAVCRSDLVAKVPGGKGGDGGDGGGGDVDGGGGGGGGDGGNGGNGSDGGGSHCGGTALAAITSWTSIAYRFPCIDLSGNTLLGILNR